MHRIRQLSDFALGLLRYDPGVCVEAANWVRIDGDPATPVQIDGEVLGELPLEIGLYPGRLSPRWGPGLIATLVATMWSGVLFPQRYAIHPDPNQGRTSREAVSLWS